MTSVSVVIVNYNGAAHLPLCLESLRRQTAPPLEILVVDNNSSDGSRLIVKRYTEALLVESGENLGFSRAANLGARAAKGEILALLNTDIELAPSFLEEGLRAMREGAVAAAASKILFFESRNVINGVGGGMNYLGYAWDRGLNETDTGQYDRPEEVFFASGGACFLRRELFLELGGFDPRFFMYHEDVDFCWRARLRGYRVITCPGAVVYHKYGATTRRELGWRQRELLGERHNLRSLLKNYELAHALRAWAEILLLPLPWNRKWEQMKNFMINLLWLPDTLRHRRHVQVTRVISDSAIQPLILQSNVVPVTSRPSGSNPAAAQDS